MKLEQIKIKLKEKIISTMKERGISQAKLGELIGSERRVINRQLNSEQTSLEKFIEFAEALGIKVEINLSSE